VSELRDCTDPESWEEHILEAVTVVGEHKLIVLPTDTVYGVGADAFSPEAVTELLAAKGRDRNKPPPVLIAQVNIMEALATEITDAARDLAENFWPGPLTLILHAQPSLMWDLGETHGTVALRVPEHEFTQELLSRTGPLAVSSANVTGSPASTQCEEAQTQLGEQVALYLDGGKTPEQEPSTIVDCTHSPPRVVRDGAVTLEELQQVVPDISEAEHPPQGDAISTDDEASH